MVTRRRLLQQLLSLSVSCRKMGHPYPQVTFPVYVRSPDGLLQARYPYGNPPPVIGLSAQQYQQVSVAVSIPSSGFFNFPLGGSRAPLTTAFIPLKIIGPRPDSDGGIGAYERHKLHPSTIPLFIPVYVEGGVAPFRYSVSSDMPGLTIGADMPRDWRTNGLQGYGCLQHSNPSIGSYTTTITVTDQVGNTDSVTYAHSVVDLNDRTKFGWMDIVNGNNANTGTYASPYAGDLTKVLGTTSASVTFQGQVWFKSAGSYVLVKHTDLTNSVRLDNTKRPVVFCALRNGSFAKVGAKFSFANTRFNSINGGNATGYYNEIDWDGGNSSLFTSFQNVLFDDSQNRIYVFETNITNPNVGSLGDDNATPIFFATGATSSDSSYNHYVGIRRLIETGRPSASNSYGMFSMYGVKNFVVEDCHTISSNAETDYYFKDSCNTGSVRYCSSDMLNSGAYGAFAIGGQNQNGGTTGSIEYICCWGNNVSITGRGIRMNAGAGQVDSAITARCTFKGFWSALNNSGAAGVYKSISDVIYTSNSPPASAGTNALTSTGTELQGNTAWFGSDGSLNAPYLAYLGIRGVEITDS